MQMLIPATARPLCDCRKFSKVQESYQRYSQCSNECLSLSRATVGASSLAASARPSASEDRNLLDSSPISFPAFCTQATIKYKGDNDFPLESRVDRRSSQPPRGAHSGSDRYGASGSFSDSEQSSSLEVLVVVPRVDGGAAESLL